MNRRQFLTGSSAAALAAGCAPAAVILAESASVLKTWPPNAIPFAGRMWWAVGQNIDCSRFLDAREWATEWEEYKREGERAIQAALARYGYPAATAPDPA